MQFVPARWFYEGRRKPIRLIVVHCTVSAEMGTGAEAVADYFASVDRKASAHRVCDNNSTVECVHDDDTAFGAAGVNSEALHLELVGQPTQTAQQWLDPYSTAELMQAGLTVREWQREHAVPLRWLTVAQVADGKTKGLCTHADVSKAFPAVSTGHWDPGGGFPKTDALRIWTPHEPIPTPPQEDDDMTPEQASQLKQATLLAIDNQKRLERVELRATDAQNRLTRIEEKLDALATRSSG